jgi:hypothetical protein
MRAVRQPHQELVQPRAIGRFQAVVGGARVNFAPKEPRVGSAVL